MMEKDTLSTNQRDSLRAVLLLGFSCFIFFAYVGFLGANGILNAINESKEDTSTIASADVKGVTTNIELDAAVPVIEVTHYESDMVLALNNTTVGLGYLELITSQTVPVQKMVLDFVIDGDLDVQDVLCSQSIKCSLVEYDQNRIRLTVDNTGAELNDIGGKVEIASIYYDPYTSGELIVNQPDSTLSIITANTDINLLSSETMFLAIGRKDL